MRLGSRSIFLAAPLLALLLLSSCSFDRMATSMVADALSSPGGSSVFTGEEDPQLVEDALPFALKLYETLLQSQPEHRGLLESAAEGFVSYANAFIHTPASQLGYDQLERQKEMYARARSMYLRGRDYALRSLETESAGITAAILSGEGAEMLREMKEEQVNALYWAAAGWMGAVSTAGFDAGALMELPQAVTLAARALELDEDFQQGAPHGLFIEIYAAVPDRTMLHGSSTLGIYGRGILDEHYRSVGMSEADLEELTRYHFERAVELSDGQSASPYVALASGVSVKNQDAEEYRLLLQQALAIDPDKTPENRLLNIITQRKARWMLETIEDRFLILE
ncbi:MAG TPA: hypothetical protein ENN41_09675 [Sediminispirochaeta sp.]|nr:hypothetical protein [Sediminispirochaeta sp.]